MNDSSSVATAAAAAAGDAPSTTTPASGGHHSVQERADLLFRNAEILAPMVRASTTPLRTLALQYGADLVYTEEIVDRSITSCDRIVNDALGTIDYVRKIDQFSPKVQRRMKANNSVPVILRIDPAKESGRLIYQMGTGEATLALPAAHLVEKDVDGIDVNMGCPKKFSVSGGMGSALLSDVRRACDIVSALRRNVSVPVSCKIRLLKDTPSTVDFVKSLIQAGANAVAIHGREVGDESTTPARWDRLAEAVQVLKSTESVPILINGDLYTRRDMVEMKSRCGADGVMLARPALYNTSIFRKPDGGTALGPDGDGDGSVYGYGSPLLLPKLPVIRDYVRHAARYQINPKNAKYVICEMMNNRRAPSSLTPFMPQRYPDGQTIDKVCKCRTHQELCALWDVRLSPVGGGDGTSKGAADGEETIQPAGEHRYDDRYFLDHDKFRRDRGRKAVAMGARVGSEEEEKKTDSGSDGGPNRTKNDGENGPSNVTRKGGEEVETSVAKRQKLQS